jgi:hypothetical protein
MSCQSEEIEPQKDCPDCPLTIFYQNGKSTNSPDPIEPKELL